MSSKSITEVILIYIIISYLVVLFLYHERKRFYCTYVGWKPINYAYQRPDFVNLLQTSINRFTYEPVHVIRLRTRIRVSGIT